MNTEALSPTPPRRWQTFCLSLLLGLMLSACAALKPAEPLQVTVLGIDTTSDTRGESRPQLKLRLTNPNEQALSYDGIALDIKIQGQDFASGVAPAKGSIERYGETTLLVPLNLSAWSVLRQLLQLGSAKPTSVSYRLQGKLGATPGHASTSFASQGELELPGKKLFE